MWREWAHPRRTLKHEARQKQYNVLLWDIKTCWANMGAQQNVSHANVLHRAPHGLPDSGGHHITGMISILFAPGRGKSQVLVPIWCTRALVHLFL